MKSIRMICGLFALMLLIGLPLTSLVGAKTAFEVIPAAEAAATPATLHPPQLACSLPARFAGSTGIYAKNLKTGEIYTFNADKVFAAASTIKVPVSVVVYRHFYKGADESQRQVYDAGVELMMTISDNEYFEEFLDEIEEKIGPQAIRDHLSRIGLTNTTIRDDAARKAYGYSNTTTAKDMAVFFEQLYAGRLLSPEKTEFMKDALSHTVFPDELARYMQDRRVLHKIGELDDVLADVGVVEGPNGPVLISIFTETNLDSDYASDQIAAMSACVYSRLTGEKTAWKDEPANLTTDAVALNR